MSIHITLHEKELSIESSYKKPEFDTVIIQSFDKERNMEVLEAVLKIILKGENQ